MPSMSDELENFYKYIATSQRDSYSAMLTHCNFFKYYFDDNMAKRWLKETELIQKTSRTTSWTGLDSFGGLDVLDLTGFEKLSEEGITHLVLGGEKQTRQIVKVTDRMARIREIK